MVENNAIYLHWKKYQKDFDKNLKNLQLRIDTDSIHDIRVATKKLRAILNLYNLLNTESKWNYLLKKTDSLFDVLGKYRDIEICLAIINSLEKKTDIRYKLLRIYLSALFKLIKGWANQEIHRFHSNELSRISLLLKQDKKLSNNEDFLQTLTLFIQTEIIATKKNVRQPHKVRKSLKEIYYWISFFPEEQMNALWHHQELHEILDDYGTWQDYQVLETRIKHFRKDFLPKSFKEYDQLKEVQFQISQTKNLLLIKANWKFKEWAKKIILKLKAKSKV